MTKLLISLGVRTSSIHKGHWSVEQGKLFLGHLQPLNELYYREGSAIEFAVALKQINNGRISCQRMNYLVELVTEQVIQCYF